MDDPNPLFLQTVGYAPMQSKPFYLMTPQTSLTLSRFYPYFILVIYLIPMYYLTSKIAEEKESKLRDGMKMMGLTDGVYQFAIFLFYLSIVVVSSGMVAWISVAKIFPKV